MSALPHPPSPPRREGSVALRVRSMQRRDLVAVAAIEWQIYPFPWTRGNFADSLSAGYDAWIFESAAGTDGAPQGYAVMMWVPDEVHLLNLSVAQEAQGAGVGRAMLEWLMHDAAQRGAHGMMLEVRPSNERAIALYRSSGFGQIGLRKRYYPAANDSREDAWVLYRKLARE